MTQQVLTTPGAATWTVPGLAVGTQITVETWGGGSGGSGTGATAGGGGAGGAYAQSIYTITPNDIASGIPYTVGAAGTGNTGVGGVGGDSIWASNTNLIWNSINYGASISGNTLPYDWWTFGLNGLTTTVVASGIVSSGVGAGLPYVDVNFSGTSTDVQFDLFVNAGIVGPLPNLASTNYCFSIYVAFIGGSLTNVGTGSLLNNGANSNFYGSDQFTLTSTLTRQFFTYTSASNDTAATLYFTGVVTTGAAVNVTIRFAGAQFELGTTPTTYKASPGYTIAKGGAAPIGTAGGVGTALNSIGVVTPTSNGSGGLVQTTFAGGNGAAFNGAGSGGGGAGGNAGAGKNGTTAGVGGQGDGTIGGAGGAVKATTPGNPGTANVEGGGGGGGLKTVAGIGGVGGLPGGGGGGSDFTSGTRTGGAGAAGQIRLSYASSTAQGNATLSGAGAISVKTAPKTATIVITDQSASGPPGLGAVNIDSATIQLNWSASSQTGIIANATVIIGSKNAVVNIPGTGFVGSVLKNPWSTQFSNQFGPITTITGVVATVIAKTTAAINGNGIIASHASHTPAGITTVNGVGAATTAAVHVTVSSIVITGTGNVQTTNITQTSSTAATFPGTALINVIATHTPSGSPIVNGVGNLVANAAHPVSDSPVLIGVGTVTATASKLQFDAALLDGNGNVSIATVSVQRTTINIAGNGLLANDSSHTPAGASAVGGVGNIIAIAASVPPESSFFFGAGNVFVANVEYFAGAFIQIGAIGNIVVTAVKNDAQSVLATAGTGAITISTANLQRGATNFAGSGVVATVSQIVLQGSVTIAGQGGVSPVLTEQTAASASMLAGNGSVIIGADHTGSGSVNIFGAGAITSVGSSFLAAGSSIAGAGATTFDTLPVASIAPKIDGTAAVTVNAVRMVVAVPAGITAQGSLIVNADHTTQGSIAVLGSGAVATLQAELFGANVTIGGTASLTTKADHTPQAGITFTGTGTVLPVVSSIIEVNTAVIHGNVRVLVNTIVHPAKTPVVVSGEGFAFLSVTVIQCPHPEQPSASRTIIVGQKVFA
jgi:hypothetical protein